MSTPALTVAALARLMRAAADRTFDPASRFTGETDSVLLGKITQLDVIGEGLWTTDAMTAAEEADLHAATGLLNRAWDHLKIVTDQAHLDAKPHHAALQCERHARHHEGSGTAEGIAKAAGYRHAVHVFRLLGALPLPAVADLRQRELPHGELFPELAATS